MADVPYKFVEERIKMHGAEASYVGNLLKDEDIPSGSKQETDVKWTALSLYFGGADTVSLFPCIFYLYIPSRTDHATRPFQRFPRST